MVAYCRSAEETSVVKKDKNAQEANTWQFTNPISGDDEEHKDASGMTYLALEGPPADLEGNEADSYLTAEALAAREGQTPVSSPSMALQSLIMRMREIFAQPYPSPQQTPPGADDSSVSSSESSAASASLSVSQLYSRGGLSSQQVSFDIDRSIQNKLRAFSSPVPAMSGTTATAVRGPRSLRISTETPVEEDEGREAATIKKGNESFKARLEDEEEFPAAPPNVTYLSDELSVEEEEDEGDGGIAVINVSMRDGEEGLEGVGEDDLQNYLDDFTEVRPIALPDGGPSVPFQWRRALGMGASPLEASVLSPQSAQNHTQSMSAPSYLSPIAFASPSNTPISSPKFVTSETTVNRPETSSHAPPPSPSHSLRPPVRTEEELETLRRNLVLTPKKSPSLISSPPSIPVGNRERQREEQEERGPTAPSVPLSIVMEPSPSTISRISGITTLEGRSHQSMSPNNRLPAQQQAMRRRQFTFEQSTQPPYDDKL